MTIYDATLAEVLARLQGSPALMVGSDEVNFRRAHNTDVPREDCPAGRVLDGPDRSAEGNCDTTGHEAEFTVRLMLRGDDEATSAAAWTLAEAVLSRLSPLTTPYANNVQIKEPTITPDREIADADLCALDMVFRMTYRSASWSLNA